MTRADVPTPIAGWTIIQDAYRRLEELERLIVEQPSRYQKRVQVGEWGAGSSRRVGEFTTYYEKDEVLPSQDVLFRQGP